MIATAFDTASVITSSILSSALVSSIVQILFKQQLDERMARIKERADRDLELLRNELATEKGAREEDRHRMSEQLKTQFSWLYVERAKAMNDIYGCVIEADEAIRSCIPPLTGWGLASDRASEARDPAIYLQRVRHAMEIGEQFEHLLRKSNLLFGENLARKLRSLALAYESIFFELDENQAQISSLADSEAIQKGELEAGHILSQIEREFRLLYGSIANSPDE
jgi:hypothetical protein